MSDQQLRNIVLPSFRKTQQVQPSKQVQLGLNISPQTRPVLKKQNSGGTVSSLSSGGVQDKKLKNNTSVQNFALNKDDQQIGDYEIDNSRRYKRSYSIRQDQDKNNFL